jgi:hypothetical protein
MALAGGDGGLKLPQTGVGATFIAASVVVLALGFGWMNNLGDDPVDELVSSLAQRAVIAKGAAAPEEIPPSQPAVPVSFGESGEIVRPDPDRARIVDPDTGLEVVITLPPGTTLVDGRVVPTSTAPTTAGSSGTTQPGPGTTGTTGASTTTTTTSGSTSTTTDPGSTTTTSDPVETTTTTVDETTTTTTTDGSTAVAA